MSQTAYVAGLLAALLWGSSYVTSKRGLDYGGSPMLLTLVVISTGTAMFWGIIVVSQGIANVAPALTPVGYAAFLVAGAVGTGIGRIANYAGIDRVGASINSAVVSAYPLVATVIAFVALGELVTGVQALGVLIVVVGLVALTLSKGGDLSGWRRLDLLVPLLATVTYGISHVIRRYGLTTTSATPIEGAALNEAAALLTVLIFIGGSRSVIRVNTPWRAYAYFIATGLLSAVATLMLFVGLQHGQVAIVSTLAGGETLVATALAYVFLRDLERVTLGVAAGVILVVAGVAIITLA